MAGNYYLGAAQYSYYQTQQCAYTMIYDFTNHYNVAPSVIG